MIILRQGRCIQFEDLKGRMEGVRLLLVGRDNPSAREEAFTRPQGEYLAFISQYHELQGEGYGR